MSDDRKPGPLGEFPRGKLSSDDEGALRLAVGVTDRTVIINFGTQVTWIGLAADDADALADLIKAHAALARAGRG